MTTSLNFASLLTFTGAGKAKREAGFASIAKTAQLETASRSALIAHCQDALGKSPSDPEIAAIRLQVQTGRVAGRITKAHLANAEQVKAFNADPLLFAYNLITRYAAPKVAGKKVRPLGKKLGYRTDLQHKLIRASDEAWSKLAADIGIGGAQTQKAIDAAKTKREITRATERAAEFGKETGAPTHEELIQPAKPQTADDVVQHIVTQAATLSAYAMKPAHAKLLPTSMGSAVMAFKAAVNAAANDFALAKAAADAKAAANK